MEKKQDKNLSNINFEDLEKMTIEELDVLITKIKSDIALLKLANNNKKYRDEVLNSIDK